MTELENGFEIISGEKHIGPATVEDLLRSDDPIGRVREFQGWMLEKINAKDQQLAALLTLFDATKSEAVRLPERLLPESFPVKLTRRLGQSQYRHMIDFEFNIFLDQIRPHGDHQSLLPYLVVRFIGHGIPNFEKIENMAGTGLFKPKGMERLLDMGLPLDVALWQVKDHPRFEPRVNQLLAMKPIMYLKGQSTMETAQEDELLTLPGVIMKVNDVARFYVADQAYEIKYESEAV